MNKAVFVDRDGTTAVDGPYCNCPENFHLFPGAAESLARLSQAGFKVIVLTNQSGIFRGYFSYDDLDRIHSKFRNLVLNAGGIIDAIYFCPHQPDDLCSCRKPKRGMMDVAISEFDIDEGLSYFVGDQEADMGMSTLCRKILVRSPDTEVGLAERSDIVHVCDSMHEAAEWILTRR